MRLTNLAIPALMLALFLCNVVLYGGFLQSEHAISFASASSNQPFDGGAGAVTPRANKGPAELAAEHAESDDSESLPGRFVPAQGRQHTPAYPLRDRVRFCDSDHVANDCYASNPPTSGLHLPVQGTVLLADGHRLRIPPDPGIYEFDVPREAIAHIEEHAGVYVGYSCASDACRTTVERIRDLVTEEISLGARVVMSPDADLDQNTIGLAAWTRVDTFDAADYSDDRVRRFIKAHSCRFDPELFCKGAQLN
ncbi:MAG: DUF3105 domain-containing protein [Chloroflexota bacterium]|nr:DUF3105 domain-containing protein [Chloroflexota bacterium]